MADNKLITTGVPAGTAAKPGLYAGTATTSGLYAKDATTCSISASGQERVTFEATRSVFRDLVRVERDGAQAGLFLRCNQNSAQHGRLVFLAGRGANAANFANLNNGDQLAAIEAQTQIADAPPGASGTHAVAGDMRILAVGTHSATNYGTRVDFHTTPQGTRTPERAVTITDDGRITARNGIASAIDTDASPADLRVATGAGKTLTLDTPVWRTITIPGTALRVPEHSPNPIMYGEVGDFSVTTCVLFLDTDTQQYYTPGSVFVLPDDYLEGSPVTIRAVWTSNMTVAATTYINLGLEVALGRVGSNISQTPSFISQGEVGYELEERLYASEWRRDNAGLKIRDMIAFRLTRSAPSTPGGAQPEGVQVTHVELRYQADTMGARTEAEK